MRKYNLIYYIILLVFVTEAAKAQPINCSTDFFTINAQGAIQQWSLSEGAIAGGEIILTDGGTSLSYCGPSDSPSFYTDNWAQDTVGIMYYDYELGWINIPTNVRVHDNGGHLLDQYYLVSGAVVQYVNYWDGTNLIVIDSLPGEFFAGIYDIAVDTAGHAWLFTASSPGSAIDSLKVYDQDGQINAYSFSYDLSGYGSFFLNNTLYLGTYQDSIYPVHIEEELAYLGEALHFPSHSFTDMASCQNTATNTSVSNPLQGLANLYPNPTDGSFSIDLGRFHEHVQLSIVDLSGKIIRSSLYDNCQVIHLNLEAPAGVYFLRLESVHTKATFRIIKE